MIVDSTYKANGQAYGMQYFIDGIDTFFIQRTCVF